MPKNKGNAPAVLIFFLLFGPGSSGVLRAGWIDVGGDKITGVDWMAMVHDEYKSLCAQNPNPSADPGCAGNGELPADFYVIHGYVAPETNLKSFEDTIKKFRTFMKDRGRRETPLWMKEFSPLGTQDGAQVQNFMRGSIRTLRTGRDAAIGPSWDDFRLVQHWAWFVLQDGEGFYEGAWDNVALFDADSYVKKPLGTLYGDLAAQALREDYPDPATRPSKHPRFGIGGGTNASHTRIDYYDYRSLSISWFFDWDASDQFQHAPDLGYMPLVSGYGRGAIATAPHADIYPNGTVWTVGNEVGFDDGRTPRGYARDYHDTYNVIQEAGTAHGKTFRVGTGAVLPSVHLYFRPIYDRAVPVPADYDGDGKVNPAIWVEGPKSSWRISYGPGDQRLTAIDWGTTGEMPVPGDYDGDGKADLAVWRPSDGTWNVRFTATGRTWVEPWGSHALGDVPVPADYNGDRKTDLAVWRQSNGTWYIRYTGTGAKWFEPWGSQALGDVPVPADYDGDRKTDLAVWRKSNGTWYVRYTGTGAKWFEPWGSQALGDMPVPADFNGDGKVDLGIFRASNSVWYVMYAGSRTTWSGPPSGFGWTGVGDVPLPRNYVNDGKAELAFWRPEVNGWYGYAID